MGKGYIFTKLYMDLIKLINYNRFNFVSIKDNWVGLSLRLYLYRALHIVSEETLRFLLIIQHLRLLLFKYLSYKDFPAYSNILRLITSVSEAVNYLPHQSKIKKSTTNSQKANFINGRNADPLTLEVSNTGIARRINREPNIAITPPNLSGIDRRIA